MAHEHVVDKNNVLRVRAKVHEDGDENITPVGNSTGTRISYAEGVAGK